VDCEKVDKMWKVSADAGEARVEEIQNSEF